MGEDNGGQIGSGVLAMRQDIQEPVNFSLPYPAQGLDSGYEDRGSSGDHRRAQEQKEICVLLGPCTNCLRGDSGCRESHGPGPGQLTLKALPLAVGQELKRGLTLGSTRDTCGDTFAFEPVNNTVKCAPCRAVSGCPGEHAHRHGDHKLCYNSEPRTGEASCINPDSPQKSRPMATVLLYSSSCPRCAGH